MRFAARLLKTSILRPGLLASAVFRALPLCASLILLLVSEVNLHAAPAKVQFTEITTQAGITFKHNLGDEDMDNIVEATAPGGMFFDYDNDGFLDIYFANGCWHPDISSNRGRMNKDKLAHALYHNNKDGTFTDVTAKAGIQCKAYGMGVTSADYDNDGDLDLFVLNYGTNVLYRNNGDGTFTDVTAKSGLGDPVWSVHAAWLDYDKDGDLDVYVANYLTYDKGAFQRTGAYYKADGFPGPLAYPGSQDHLFRNNSDGTFTDVTKDAGLTAPNGRGMSVVAADFDKDGDVDIYVTNDAMPNFLWINDGQGHFTDKALEFGAAFGEGGQGVSSMGPFVGDIDRNGWLDIFVPDMGFGTLLCQLNRNQFMDMTAQTGLTVICGQYTGWGGIMVDYDNDGHLDIFVANGDPHHLYKEEAVLARNDGKGRFTDVAKDSGEFFQKKVVGRGAVYGDIDNDGDMDLLVCTVNGAPCLLRNDGASQQPWIKVVPLQKNGMVAIHSTITVKSGNLTQTQPAMAVNGYLGCNDPRPNFGLGTISKIDWVEVVWPDGTRRQIQSPPANRILTVRYGEQ